MAEVFEGRDRLLARRVAVKVLLAQFARDPAFLVRFKREAQAAASLSHPNIVAVYDTGVEAGTSFIVMEFVEGRTLREVLRAEGPLLAARAAEVAAEVCGALAAAHARGLVHRDIKPGNVMLTPAGVVKVMDFGIARAATSETITQASAVVGTAQYISPEQAQGQPVDARSDLYSLGCCLFEMVAGVVPFSGPTPVAIAYRHVREAPTPPRQLNPDVPAGLEAVVLKAMAKHPGNRYQTAAELRQDLERFLAGRGVLATPLLDARELWPAGPATRAGTGATALVPGSDEAVTSVITAASRRPGGSAGRPRRSLPGWVAWMAAVLLLAVPVAFFMVNSIGGIGGSAGTSLAPSATGPGLDPAETVATPTTRLAVTASVPPVTTPETTVAVRPELVRVPRVVGSRFARARAVLTEAGFTVARVDVPVGQRSRAGRVLVQSPGPGSEAPAGSQVTVVVGVTR